MKEIRGGKNMGKKGGNKDRIMGTENTEGRREGTMQSEKRRQKG